MGPARHPVESGAGRGGPGVADWATSSCFVPGSRPNAEFQRRGIEKWSSSPAAPLLDHRKIRKEVENLLRLRDAVNSLSRPEERQNVKLRQAEATDPFDDNDLSTFFLSHEFK